MRPLSFRQIVQKLALIGVLYSDPYENGPAYFVGKGPGHFPYARGPIVFVGQRDPQDIVAGKVIGNWLDRLDLSREDIQAFWDARGQEERKADSGKAKDSK